MKKDIFALIENQQQMIGESHKAFMDLIKEYMHSNGDIYDFSNEKALEESESKISQLECEEDSISESVSGRQEEEESEGYRFDSLGLPEIASYDEDDIDLDDPRWATGMMMGIPKAVDLNYGPRGEIDSLLPIKRLFVDYGG